MYYYTKIDSPVGWLTLCSDGEFLKGLWPESDKHIGDVIDVSSLDDMTRRDDLNIFSQTEQWIDEYFAGKMPDVKRLPLSPNGSPFRQEVWKLLLQIPYGETTTYGRIADDLAAMTGKGPSARAVGGAIGHNPISIIIPCHRVIGANGSLTGFASGLETKRFLLEHEGVITTRA